MSKNFLSVRYFYQTGFLDSSNFTYPGNLSICSPVPISKANSTTEIIIPIIIVIIIIYYYKYHYHQYYYCHHCDYN